MRRPLLSDGRGGRAPPVAAPCLAGLLQWDNLAEIDCSPVALVAEEEGELGCHCQEQMVASSRSVEEHPEQEEPPTAPAVE